MKSCDLLLKSSSGGGSGTKVILMCVSFCVYCAGAGNPCGPDPGNVSGMMGATCLFPSAIILCINTPTPSKTPSRIPHMMPEPSAVFGPLLIARPPPVIKPAMMAFQGSSFCLIPLTAQSKEENMPPQTPKFPPRTGARALMAEREPGRRSPRGELRAPLMPCQMVPPTAPMAKAPPKSFRMTQGHGSRVWSAWDIVNE